MTEEDKKKEIKKIWGTDYGYILLMDLEKWEHYKKNPIDMKELRKYKLKKLKLLYH